MCLSIRAQPPLFSRQTALLLFGIVPLPEDILHTLRGVGGTEVVFTRRPDSLQVGREHRLTNFEIEVGGMDYGFEMHGILGMDFLIQGRRHYQYA